VTGQILRIELLRSAFWATVAGVLITFTPTVGQGMSVLAGNQRGALALAPVAVGIGAWRARRDRRSGMVELLGTTARPSWQRLSMTAAALGIGVLAGYVVTFAGLTAYAAVVGAYLPLGAFAATAATALYLVGSVWLGLAIGRLLPFVIVPPLLIVVGFVGTFILILGADLEGYTQGPGATGRPPATVLLDPLQTEGFEYAQALTAPAHLAQAVWALGLATACLLLFVASRLVRIVAAVPVVLALVAATALLPTDLADAIVFDRTAMALVCTPDDPQICTRRVHHRVIDDLREPGRAALSILSAKLPQAPSSVVQTYTVHGTGFLRVDPPPPDPNILYAEVIPNDSGRAGKTEREMLWILLDGAGTPRCNSFDPSNFDLGEGQYVARLVAAAWLVGEPPSAAPAEDWSSLAELPATRPTYEALLALPEDEQRARVAALRAAELACDDTDRLEILSGDSRP